MKARINLIVARARNGVIGRGNEIPWKIPGEQALFKRVTMGHPVIMGRKTWESIVKIAGRALPGRRNIVVTRNASYVAPGAEVAASLDAALALCADAAEVFVIGGAELYAQALPAAQRAYVTEIDADFEGDTFFPALDPRAWREIAREHRPVTPERACGFDFVTYERAG